MIALLGCLIATCIVLLCLLASVSFLSHLVHATPDPDPAFLEHILSIATNMHRIVVVVTAGVLIVMFISLSISILDQPRFP